MFDQIFFLCRIINPLEEFLHLYRINCHRTFLLFHVELHYFQQCSPICYPQVCLPSPYQVYIVVITLSSIYIISSTIYRKRKYILYRKRTVGAFQAASFSLSSPHVNRGGYRFQREQIKRRSDYLIRGNGIDKRGPVSALRSRIINTTDRAGELPGNSHTVTRLCEWPHSKKIEAPADADRG